MTCRGHLLSSPNHSKERIASHSRRRCVFSLPNSLSLLLSSLPCSLCSPSHAPGSRQERAAPALPAQARSAQQPLPSRLCTERADEPRPPRASSRAALPRARTRPGQAAPWTPPSAPDRIECLRSSPCDATPETEAEPQPDEAVGNSPTLSGESGTPARATPHLKPKPSPNPTRLLGIVPHCLVSVEKHGLYG
jgi:hypothetical protein